ncbi:MAG: toxin-activating lysine-acyltransferase [Gemmobacter sp.]|jgi:hypothetical protein|nr:toxin-activating lysine-acyltransferase [Gemmobacter sp.]
MASSDEANGSAGVLVPADRQTDPVAGKTIAEILGEIVWLMTQDAAGREMKVSEIERLVMPAILERRFHIRYTQVPDMTRRGAVTLQPVMVEILAAQEVGAGSSHAPGAITTFTLSRKTHQ